MKPTKRKAASSKAIVTQPSANLDAPTEIPKRPEPAIHDLIAAPFVADALDRAMHASVAKITKGLSPAAMAGAYLDWTAHLWAAPGKQLELGQKALRKVQRLARFATRCAPLGKAAPPCIEPLPQDQRFRDPAWQKWPYNLLYQSFLMNQQWWHNATTDVQGVTKQHEDVMDFATRQILDMFSPSNYLADQPRSTGKNPRRGGAEPDPWHAASGRMTSRGSKPGVPRRGPRHSGPGMRWRQHPARWSIATILSN